MVSYQASHIASVLLSNEPCMLLDSSNSNEGQCLFLHSPREVYSLYSLADIEHVFDNVVDSCPDCIVAGYLTYEAGYVFDAFWNDHRPDVDEELLGVFAVFNDYSIVSREIVDEALDLIICEPGVYDVVMQKSAQEYRADIESALHEIRNGDYYQINYTLECLLEGPYSVPGLYKYLRVQQPVEFGAWIRLLPDHNILSFSPELFFTKAGDFIQCKPMKGTLPVGADEQETEVRKEMLRADEKNRAENVMIVDLLRNDLSRICAPGSVQVASLFDIETLPSVLQMTSTIRGRLSSSSISEILAALYPCGSITGAPKLAAMKRIREFEMRNRGVYTGSIGMIMPNGDAEFSVAIRTLECTNERTILSVGSGIVADSVPEEEYSECLDKVRFAQAPSSFQLIETMRWEEGKCTLYKKHVERLCSSARTFGVPLSMDVVVDYLEHLTTPKVGVSRVRLTCSMDGHLQSEWSSIDENSTGTQIRIVLSDRVVFSQDQMRRHKTSQRTDYNEDYERALLMGFQDMLYVNEHGHVVETTRANVFVKLMDGRWSTPPLEDGCLPGVMRSHVLENGYNGESIRVESITLKDLAFAEEILLTNAVVGTVEVDVKNSSLEAVGWFS